MTQLQAPPAVFPVTRLTELDAAVAELAGAEGSVTVTGEIVVDSDRTYPANVAIFVRGAGRFVIQRGVDLTIQGPFEAPLREVFVGNRTDAPVLERVEAVYPQWFGTVEDGVTSDYNALQAALDVAAGRAPVILPRPKTAYFIERTRYLQVPSDTVLLGHGSRIEAESETDRVGSVLWIRDKERVTIRGLRFTSAATTIRYLAPRREGGTLDPNFDGAVEQQQRYDHWPSGEETTSFRQGIHISDCHHVTIEDCSFERMHHAIKIDAEGKNTDFKIDKITCRETAACDIYLSDCHGIEFSNVYSLRCGQSRFGNGWYIQNGCDGVHLENIHIEGGYGTGLAVFANGAPTRNVVINNLTIRDRGLGVWLSGGGGCDLENVVVSNLIVENMTDQGNVTDGNGIRIAGRCRHVTINGFQIYNVAGYGCECWNAGNRHIVLANGEIRGTTRFPAFVIKGNEGTGHLRVENVDFTDCLCAGGAPVLADNSNCDGVPGLVVRGCNFTFTAGHEPTGSVVNIYRDSHGLLQNLYFWSETPVPHNAMWFSPASAMVADGCWQHNFKGLT